MARNSTIEDFENAPVGATATHDKGKWAVKLSDVEWGWLTSKGIYLTDQEMEQLGYTLDTPAPATAREALDLAWELAHEVRPGQVIPKGTPYLVKDASGLKEYIAWLDLTIIPAHATVMRTFDPLPDPEPDWVDAPAVIAVCNDIMAHAVFVRRGNDQWRSEFYEVGTADLRDVTPLYPREKDR